MPKSSTRITQSKRSRSRRSASPRATRSAPSPSRARTTTRSAVTEPKAPFAIEAHRLIGHSVVQRATPNCGGSITPRYLVFHYTAGRSAADACDWLCNPAANASAHLVVGRDGSITQLAPFNIKTWHAGVSQWEGLIGLNSHSIGIELDNAGPLREAGAHLQAWFGGRYTKNEALFAQHRLDTGPKWWHTYTDVQVQRALDLALLLVREYHLLDVIGHEDIAPDRKRDPGPAFPLDAIRSRVLGRRDDTRERARVIAEALNMRTGPGTEYELAGPPLAKHTTVWVLEKSARWTKVDVSDETDLEGWVANRFLEPVTD